jgi:hypothetical protein
MASEHIAECGLCGERFAADEPIRNTFCPACPKGGMRGVLNSGTPKPATYSQADLDAAVANARKTARNEVVAFLRDRAGRVNLTAGDYYARGNASALRSAADAIENTAKNYGSVLKDKP